MTKNVTLRMDESLLRRIRHRAVDEGLSLSAYIVREMNARVNRGSARSRALRLLDKPMRLKGSMIRREDLHER